ncbi:hypothetical protein HHK36_021727 [Tetracentron sinense]|uniref:Core-2/I-branching beta-1,6-N-acetylglucosaminyltransferase family protein n=1 Tax=Tetracentron sinense TaxID=13715 RepID=A0A835D7C3_TETSI|nr:hypothetical protein HHK36_021727 [Tetracentron sinense]
MQSRVVPIEEGKDPTTIPRANQSRVLPLRLLQFFMLFLVLCLGFSFLSMYMIRYFGLQNVVTTAQSSFQPCIEELSSLQRLIRPPSSLVHSMTDDELLWRASFVPKIKKYPFSRIPKIAFMFLTKGPMPLAPIWERFLKGHEGLYSIYVHSLPSYIAKFPPSSVFYRRQIPSQNTIPLHHVEFLECDSPLPEDQAGEKEEERMEGYGRGTTSWLCFWSSKLRYLNSGIKRELFKDGNTTQYRRGRQKGIENNTFDGERHNSGYYIYELSGDDLESTGLRLLVMALVVMIVMSFMRCFTWLFAWNARIMLSARKVSEWGRMSMCDAERRLLANALLDISNEWFILLSESCIPLYNFSSIHHYILRSRHSFIGAFDDQGPYGRGRYNENMAPEVNITQWRKGSQWFEINRRLAVNIVEDTMFYKKFEEFCRPACYVDEHYFPTMLTIQASHLLANRSITWVDWSRGGPHPATFGKSDITEDFLKRIFEGHSCIYNNQSSSICFLFARKFAPSALEPLLQFAPKFLGF